MSSMNPFRSRAQQFEFGPETALQIERLIRAVENSGDQQIQWKLDTLIETIEPLRSLPARFELMETRLETIHGLINDIVSADPAKIRELANAVRTVKEKLKSSVDSQTKGD